MTLYNEKKDIIDISLSYKDAIKLLKNIKNKNSKIENLWENDIYTKNIYEKLNNIMPFFWYDKNTLDNKELTINEFLTIPWYYNFELYEQIMKKYYNISLNELWSFNNKDKLTYNEKNNLQHTVVDNNILKNYLPVGYLIPPIDTEIISFKYNKKEILNDNKKSYQKVFNNLEILKKNNLKETNVIALIKQLNILKQHLNNNEFSLQYIKNIYYIYKKILNNNSQKINNFTEWSSYYYFDILIDNKIMMNHYSDNVIANYLENKEDFDKILNKLKTIDDLVLLINKEDDFLELDNNENVKVEIPTKKKNYEIPSEIDNIINILPYVIIFFIILQLIITMYYLKKNI